MFKHSIWNNIPENSKLLLKYLGLFFLVIAYFAIIEGGAPQVIFDLDFPALRIPASWSLP